MEAIIAKVKNWDKEAKFFAENNSKYSDSFRESELKKLEVSCPTQEQFEIVQDYELKNLK